jgi:hypothetical protein
MQLPEEKNLFFILTSISTAWWDGKKNVRKHECSYLITERSEVYPFPDCSRPLCSLRGYVLRRGSVAQGRRGSKVSDFGFSPLGAGACPSTPRPIPATDTVPLQHLQYNKPFQYTDKETRYECFRYSGPPGRGVGQGAWGLRGI